MPSQPYRLTFALTLALSLCASTTLADPLAPRIDAFAESVKQNKSLTDAQRASLLSRIAKQRKDEYDRIEVMTDVLRATSPEFARGLSLMAEEDMAGARAVFQPLLESKDAYLAAHAAYFTARSLTLENAYDAAKPLLTELTDGRHKPHTLYTGEALFLLGVAQAESLDREAASKTFGRFLRDHPEAPERMRIGALHMINDLATIDQGSIIDVHDRMDFIGRRIARADTGKTSQKQQDTVIAMLDKLIEEAEKKEQQGGGGGGGGGAGGGGSSSGNTPSSPAESSTAPVGDAQLGGLHRINRGSAADAWGAMKRRERDRVFSAIKGQFPERYKELVEQYYKSLQDEKQK